MCAQPQETVFSSHTGANADIIREACALYVRNGALVADVTYGLGAFWKKTDTTRFKLLRSDLKTCPDSPYDFRKLPYKTGSIEVVVLDPPYIHNTGSHMFDRRYQNGATTKGMNHADIMNLYREGMTEALRVLTSSGQLWVKCKDEVESGVQRWSHLELYQIAVEMGLYPRDLFVLTTSRTSTRRWQSQHHARKNHSFLWIFDKTRRLAATWSQL